MPQPAATSSTLSVDDEDSLPFFIREGRMVDCRIDQIGSLFLWAAGESIVTIFESFRFDMVVLVVVDDDDGLLDVVISGFLCRNAAVVAIVDL